MRKYGKFERMPDGTRAKPPKVKNVLLQTYFTSLLCMVLCVSMFFGTSYAWFTSEVNNQGNEIYIGTLKAGLDKNVGTDGWKSLSDKIDGVNVTNLFDKNIRWEPGYTSLETIRVTNMGDLAFKYTLYFTDGQIANDTQSDLAAVAGNFDVWIFDHHANKEKTEAVSNPANYDQITEANGWTPIGTLADVLNGKAVLENKIMETVRDNNADTPTNPGTTDGVATTDTYTIALHMKESATGEGLMGKKIVLNVKLVAYQMGHETDAFGNAAYDDAKFVTTAKELQAALDNATGNTVIRFANDIIGDVTVTQKEGINITLDGAGNKFNGVMTAFGNGNQSGAETLTIKNINFVAANGAESCIVSPDRSDNEKYSYAHNVTVENCTFTDPDGELNCAAIRHEDGGDKDWRIIGCTVDETMHSLLQTNNVVGKLTISGCTVKSKNGINLNSCTNVDVMNCNFDVKGYAVRFGVNSGGNPDEAKNYVIKDSVLKSGCNDGDAVIMFRASAVNANLTLTNTTITGTPEISGNTTATTINRN